MTKTNELKYHATDCQYRLASEIEEALTFEDDTISKTAPSAVVLDDERALTDAAALCDAIANGFVSDVNPDRSREASQGASACAQAIRGLLTSARPASGETE
jgi:hypothetical protein